MPVLAAIVGHPLGEAAGRGLRQPREPKLRTDPSERREIIDQARRDYQDNGSAQGLTSEKAFVNECLRERGHIRLTDNELGSQAIATG